MYASLQYRYANRAKNIKNKPRINEDPKDALLREYQEEIQRLKVALEKRKVKGGGDRQKKGRKKRLTASGEGKFLTLKLQLNPLPTNDACMHHGSLSFPYINP